MVDNIKDIDETLTPQKIAAAINNNEYKDLADYIREIEWYRMDGDLIVHKWDLRAFTKSIHDKNKRRLVMHYLLDNAEYYFSDPIEDMINLDLSKKEREETYNEYLNEFKEELRAQIRQLEEFETKDIVVINRLQEKNKILEKQVKDQQEEIVKLEKKVHFYEHPSEYGKQIPDELNHKVFLYTMEFLVANRIAMYCREPNDYGVRELTCYYWTGRKGAFGYFVDRMNEELGLRKEGCLIKWKPFEKAFINYKDIIDEARNTVSYYTNKTQNGKTSKMPDLFPKTAEIVENAIEYAREKENNESQNQEKKRLIIPQIR